MEAVLRINEKEYRKGSSATFEVPWSELSGARFGHVPYYSTIDVTNLPGSDDSYRLGMSATHSGGPANEQFFVHVHVTFTQPGDWNTPSAVAICGRRLRHIRRFFRPIADALKVSDGHGNDQRQVWGDRFYCCIVYSRYFDLQETDFDLREFLCPFVERFSQFLLAPDLLFFICHASEDNLFVEQLCSILDANDIPLWYDKREIKVGDSIVERVSDGIGTASHLLLVLSTSSVQKPWVKKEFSAALMRQLQSEAIHVIPLLVNECEVPALLSDIKYVDCRGDIAVGVRRMLDDILGS
jgi:hypothetical protein